MAHPSLTERQKIILALTVQEYTKSTQPVGSKKLRDAYMLDMSSATIRNEMVVLAEHGFLRQPHTSAGRIPTEEGYRYFVGQLMGQSDNLPVTTKETITHQFYQAKQDTDQWMRLAASVLANQSLGASLVTTPFHSDTRFKNMELISIRGRQVLMVLVMDSGEVRQQMLNLTEPVAQEQLRQTTSTITNRCANKTGAEILALAETNDALADEILKIVKGTVSHSSSILSGEVYRDGLLNVLTEPEFAENESARQALRVLEERTLLEDLLSQTVMNTEIGVVQVIIGGEGNWKELSQASVVLARYGIPGTATGMLGVLGPIRMRYGRTISTVRFVAGLLSEWVHETHVD